MANENMKQWISTVVLAAGIVASAAVYQHRVDALEVEVTEIQSTLKTKASADDMKEIRDTLGALQLDVSLLCAVAVKARGGNPMLECRTSGGRR
jgi:hypothetical protein